MSMATLKDVKELVGYRVRCGNVYLASWHNGITHERAKAKVFADRAEALDQLAKVWLNEGRLVRVMRRCRPGAPTEVFVTFSHDGALIDVDQKRADAMQYKGNGIVRRYVLAERRKK